ncbi:MAG: enoyl-CoA hydratase, partial [Hyphomonas sp.]|nr:enoyl-CoA hydratase [Hyphomonas sp.]
MADDIILVERDGPVALVTLNRPDALNALSRALRTEIVRVFTELKDDPDIRAVVLTGAGRAFTAGVDLKEAGQTGFALGADEDSKAINILAAI